MEAFLQSNHSGSRNRCVRTIIIDHRFVIDVQDTAIIRTGLESIDSILGYIDQPGKNVSEMVLLPGILYGWLGQDTRLQQWRFFYISHGDYASGNANILQAFTEAALIALGVYIGLVIIS